MEKALGLPAPRAEVGEALIVVPLWATTGFFPSTAKFAVHFPSPG
jgi:hypothetical protein